MCVLLSFLLSMVRLVGGRRVCMFLMSVLMLVVSIFWWIWLRRVCSGLGLVSVVLNSATLSVPIFVS